MDERLRFVARLLDGEKMAALCREFDVSRKTGYKIFQRYKDCGLEGLTDRSRRPYRQANQLPFQIEKLIVLLKRERPSWGAPKLREKLRRLHSEIPTPAISTVHAVLDRHGLVNRGRKRRYKAQGTTLSKPLLPNDLWCADFKGEFKLGNGQYCYPLTVTDHASRYLLLCEALESNRQSYFRIPASILKGGNFDIGIRCLTIFSFSSENWQRPASEVRDLMSLLRLFIRKDLAELHDLRRMDIFIRPVHFGDVHQAFDARLDLDERAVVGNVRDLAEQARALRVAARDAVPRVVAELLDAERDAVLLGVELQDLGLQLLADLLPGADTGFPLRVPRGFVARMRHGDRSDPLLRQVLPLAAELGEVPGFTSAAELRADQRDEAAPVASHDIETMVLCGLVERAAHGNGALRRGRPPRADPWRSFSRGVGNLELITATMVRWMNAPCAN